MLSLNDIFDKDLSDEEIKSYVDGKWKEKDGFYAFITSLSDEQVFKLNKALNKFQHPIREQYRLYDYFILKVNKYAQRLDCRRKYGRGVKNGTKV